MSPRHFDGGLFVPQKKDEMVVVYEKPSCVQCTMTTKLLDKEGIPYKTISLVDDPDAISTIKELGYLAAPVVVVGEVSWSGFRPDKIEEFINSSAVA